MVYILGEQLRFDFPAKRRKPTFDEWCDIGVDYDPTKIPAEFIERIEEGNWRRAGGGVVCDRCGLSYSDHPRVPHAALTLLCNGDLVHL